MRPIKIKVKPSTMFWMLDDIVSLTPKDPISPFIDLDSLTEQQIEIINKSLNASEIRLFGQDNNEIINLHSVSNYSNFQVETDDIEEEYVPKVSSVTVSIEEYEDDKEEDTAYEDEAVLVLNKNGNTLKKMISAMSKDSIENVKLLEAMLKIEKADKNRPNIVESIKKVLGA